MSWYGEQFPLRTEAVECALAWWLTFFAQRAWRPEVPGLSRLRCLQRQQPGVLISWTACHWSFPSPGLLLRTCGTFRSMHTVKSALPGVDVETAVNSLTIQED
jgi:hypothetical protein